MEAIARYSWLGAEGRLESEAPPSSLKTFAEIARQPHQSLLLDKVSLGGCHFHAALGDPMSWFVAEETYACSGPVEAANHSRLTSLRSNSEFVFGVPFLSQYSVDLA